jgi:17beta-estradiol 17-dehydrogenase / very-long-chain 3-oxoacyl-CoA reductase
MLNELVIILAYSHISYLFLKLLIWIYKVTLRTRKPHNSIYGQGSWVFITGASEGIGKTFAEKFAKQGFNLVLVSRNISKLKKCEETIKNLYQNIEIISIPFDFTKKISINDYQNSFGDVIRKKDISILINNIGLRDVRKFTEFTLDEVHNIIVANTIPQVLLSKMILDKFYERKNRSAVINISSSSSVYPLPLFVLYSSTKIFNHNLSIRLNYEINNKIDIISATPFFVQTSTVKMTPNGLTVITSDQFVNSVLDQLGYESHTYGYWSQQLLGFIFENVVEYILFLVVYFLNKRKKSSEVNNVHRDESLKKLKYK